MSETIEAAHLPRFQFPPDGKKAKILEIIEKIRHCDLEQDIDVPELVLCGQQSSGKSSVLEALTGLEFPKGDGGACTRFPIEIRLFSGAETSYIKSKVRFCPRPSDDSSAINDFQDHEDPVEISSHCPGDLINRAKEIMGISDVRRFSHNVLSIEYHFPDPASPTHAPRLTLIDLPGIVAVGDQELVERYTKKYIQRTTSLVLAVLNGAEDLENLRILKMVNDSACTNRTFGIITKPDMTHPGSGLEAGWVKQVLKPDREQFGLGSHVVYNRSPTQTQDETRFPPNLNNDRYKEKIPNGWHEVYKMESSDRWGIQNLRNRLVALLSDRASEQVLPIYRGQMRKSLENAIYDLRKLANQASTGSYQEQVSSAIHKDGPFFVISKESCRWLRSKIDKKSKEFYEAMKTRGHNSNKLEERKEAALATLKLLDYDRGDAPMSLHPDMWMVAKSNAIRLSDNLKTIKPAKPEPVQLESKKPGDKETDILLQRAELAVVNRMTALKQLENLMLVYKKCRDTYIDNVVVQVVQRCLLRGFDDLFRHDWMYNNALFDKITKDPNKDANAEKERTLREHISILTSAEADLEKLLGNYNRD
ncbi:dynamin family domain-containing protein [Trichoderma breve]|uniref:Dynamin family domain-containing protein n=1 Tax=Trichoderma breve TaxID=2034170 RepID=A0A9W9JRD1_9HYPO|nr:dynamin family domain-containing protein [Trichoderma breve]KAJ4864748.1 dynamin family domain-containing protein [Trichoderma breve]